MVNLQPRNAAADSLRNNARPYLTHNALYVEANHLASRFENSFGLWLSGSDPRRKSAERIIVEYPFDPFVAGNTSWPVLVNSKSLGGLLPRSRLIKTDLV
jgi:hypothetical protein